MYTFSCEFCSGSFHDVSSSGGDAHSVIVTTRPDLTTTNYRTWFYFSVTGGSTGQNLKMRVENMNNQGKLFKHDFRPVVRSHPSQPQWERLPVSVQHELYDPDQKLFAITFSHRFATDSETVYFAFTFPYSFSDILLRTNELQVRHQPLKPKPLKTKRKTCNNAAQMQAGLCSRDGGV
jgi:hypothetical protein